MSKEAHPNLHAVGFATDLLRILHVRLRGPAMKAPTRVSTDPKILAVLSDATIAISDRLDEMFPKRKKQ
jgi:hypothetical protein